jgi:hypothetical protein
MTQTPRLISIKMWDETSPEGKFMLGCDFAEAAKHLANNGLERSNATIFCICHAAEMMLKSYLSSHSYTAEFLEFKAKHDLAILLDEAVKDGIRLDQQASETIREFGNVCRGPEYAARFGREPTRSGESPISTMMSIPHPTEALEVLDRLAAAVKPSIPGLHNPAST